MKHTPGPWKYERSPHHTAVWLIDYATKKNIGETHHYAAMGEVRSYEADARLIAAAPELLDAVFMLLGCTDLNTDDLDETSIEAIEMARQAIAKAEGRESNG